MKAAALSSRPEFNLMKQTDVQTFSHLQMPRWLFSDEQYKSLSLEAKVAYTFLRGRFQLSRQNNWTNADGEVFIIYTRKALAAEMRISYRRVIECMKELAAAGLIWERRCGRGEANQIYLARIEQETKPVCENAPEQEVRDLHIKTCGSGSSRDEKPAHQELRDLHTSNINKNNTEKNYKDSQSVYRERGRKGKPPKRATDDEIRELDEIISQCNLWLFDKQTAKVFESAIERLFFTESYKIGKSVLPGQKVRSHLHELDQMKLETALEKISRNTEKEIKNTTAYTMAVVFNSIWETESDLMNDPYLNSLRNSRPDNSGSVVENGFTRDG